MTTLNCATGTIVPYVPSTDRPWNRRRAAHLFRRMGFGANQQELDNALNANPTALVDEIINQAIGKPLPEIPEWGDWSLSNYDQDNVGEQATQQVYEWVSAWIERMAEGNNFREKLELFWHNHFVTRLDDYGCPSYMYQYHTLIQQHCLGNFKDFTHEMGKNPAMLMFLNGFQNTRFEPNENYARELLELFTLGQGNNYTQQDIEEVARALTGFNNISEACAEISFSAFNHDNGMKTIFNQTGNWGYEEVHDILFSERVNEIANHICTKIYYHFVNPEIDQDIINEMVTTFKDNDFNLAAVYRQLFKSEHFFDDANMDIQVKSPVEMMVRFMREVKFPYPAYFNADENVNQALLQIYFFSTQLGQQLMNPINVAGWDGNRAWVNTNTLVGRWQILDAYVFSLYENFKFILVDFAKEIAANTNDPNLITQLIIEHFIPVGLQTPQDYERATIIFKSDFVPENYYQDGTWTLNYNEDIVAAQVALLMQHISRIPEFQLS